MTPAFTHLDANLYIGDCLEVMRTLPDASVDSIVTDPPYGLSFMGKKWDYDVPSVDIWTECLRVLKPGGHLLSFAGTRTQHRMAVRIEDAGFEIRDMIAWVYGSGFSKSLDVSKAIDKAAGAQREVVGSPVTPEAQKYEGWGTALKPALEPITVARKPLIGTVAANVVAHGTGGLNIDGCRVGTEDKLGGGSTSPNCDYRGGHEGWQRPWMKDAGACESAAARRSASVARSESLGRWPANLIHDGSEEVVKLTGEQARFFYCAKASKADRDEGLDDAISTKTNDGRAVDSSLRKNHHPTVKPTDLMRYLCRLVTPPGGVVLDPFMGSGSTGKAAIIEGFKFIGIELNPDYLDIAAKRIKPHPHGTVLPFTIEN